MSLALILHLARKDLRLEARTGELLGLMLVLCALILVTLRAAFEAGSGQVSAAAALWITTGFVATLGLARPFHAEAESGTLDLLLASPATKADLYLAKAISGSVVAIIGALMALVFVWAFFGDAVLRGPLQVALLLVAGAVGLAAQAALLSAASARSRSRGAVFAVIFLPLVLPVIIWGVQGTQAAATGGALTDGAVGLHLAMLAAYDVLFLALNGVLAGFVLDG